MERELLLEEDMRKWTATTSQTSLEGVSKQSLKTLARKRVSGCKMAIITDNNLLLKFQRGVTLESSANWTWECLHQTFLQKFDEITPSGVIKITATTIAASANIVQHSYAYHYKSIFPSLPPISTFELLLFHTRIDYHLVLNMSYGAHEFLSCLKAT